MSLKIMFHGPAGCGKDTAADYLIAKYGGVKVKFARKVYEIAYMIQNELGLENYKDRKLLQILDLNLNVSIVFSINSRLKLFYFKNTNEYLLN